MYPASKSSVWRSSGARMNPICAYDGFSVCVCGSPEVFAAKSTGTTAARTPIQRCLIVPHREAATFGKNRKRSALAFSANVPTISAKTKCFGWQNGSRRCILIHYGQRKQQFAEEGRNI